MLLHVDEPLIAKPRSLGKRAEIPVGKVLLPHAKDVREVGDDPDDYPCISRAGRPRLFHQPDRDGVCCLCDHHDRRAEVQLGFKEVPCAQS